MTRQNQKLLLPTLVFAIFAGASLWFSSNAILDDILATLGHSTLTVSDITSAVQLGFIVGTLTFSWFNIADRFKPSILFFGCCVLGGLSNAWVALFDVASTPLIISRFLTGFFLAGIYPIGVKIAAQQCAEQLGRALGLVVGALVLGTAFPHFLNSFEVTFNWSSVLFASSGLAILGGLFVFALVPNTQPTVRTPHHEGWGLFKVFKTSAFKASSFGYFGHMWELYTFWAFVPLILTAYAQMHQLDLNIALLSFLVIAAGALGCAGGGFLALQRGSAEIAFAQLATSCVCCLLFPLALYLSPTSFILYLLIWGTTVAGDSPQFSTLNAKTAPAEIVGSAVTMVICIGFTLTIISLNLFEWVLAFLNLQTAVLVLSLGPLYGLYSMRTLFTKTQLP